MGSLRKRTNRGRAPLSLAPLLASGLLFALVACTTPPGADTGGGEDSAAPEAPAPRPTPTPVADGSIGQAAPYVPTASGAPSTDVYVAELIPGDRLRVGALRNITNRDGYDNQPAFVADGTAVLYTSGRDGVQTDIYRYDLATGATRQVTNTPASEYSPTPHPGGGFVTIHEAAGLQQLWRFDLDGTDRGGLIGHVQPVGYQAWGAADTVVVFVLGAEGSPATLQRVDVASGEATVLIEEPGRSLHRVPGRRAISFVDKREEEWWLSEVNLDSGEITRLVTTLPGREDYAWTPAGTVLMGDASILYGWRQGADWTLVADFGEQGVRELSRLAVSPAGDRIALVGSRDTPE